MERPIDVYKRVDWLAETNKNSWSMLFFRLDINERENLLNSYEFERAEHTQFLIFIWGSLSPISNIVS